MDWRTFITRIVSALAWPSVVLILLGWRFQETLVEISGRILNLEGLGFKVQLREGLDRVEAKLTESVKSDGAEKPPTSEAAVQPVAPESQPEYVTFGAYNVIRNAFMRMQEVLNALVRKSGMRVSGSHRAWSKQYNEALRRAGAVESDIDAFNELYNLRRKAEYAPHTITLQDALRFDQLSDTLIRRLKALL